MKKRLVHRSGKPGGHDTSRYSARQSIIGYRLFVIVLALVLALENERADAAPAAQEILASARLRASQQEVDVHGQLRENDLIVPFRLTQTGPVVRYSFTNPDEALQLRLGEADSKIEEITTAGVDKISGPEFDQRVRGTAITYEDLALKFIYWPKANVLGEDYINTRRVW